MSEEDPENEVVENPVTCSSKSRNFSGRIIPLYPENEDVSRDETLQIFCFFLFFRFVTTLISVLEKSIENITSKRKLIIY